MATFEQMWGPTLKQAAAAVAEFFNPKTKALASGALRELQSIKATYDDAPNMPSNVGAFIKYLFYALGNQAAFHAVHSLLGNMPGVGSGLGVDKQIEPLARVYANKLNQAEAAAVGVYLLKAVKRPRAAAAFEAWADRTLDLVMHDPRESGAVKPMSAGQAFEASITSEIKALAADAWGRIGKTPDAAVTLAYDVAEDVNWHGIQGVDEVPGVDLPQGLVHDIGVDLGWGLEDAAAFIVVLLRLAGLRRQAEMVKKQALQEFSDAYGPVARVAQRRVAQRRVAFNKENAPELMTQLLAVLAKAELKDAVNQIRQKGIPDLVNKAWSKRKQVV